MGILIEATQKFEKDIIKLSNHERENAIKKINSLSVFFLDKNNISNDMFLYKDLQKTHFSFNIDGYESSLYHLKTSRRFRIILAIDEDPIFDQIIFTLFRIVHYEKLNRAYRGLAESLYQKILHKKQ